MAVKATKDRKRNALSGKLGSARNSQPKVTPEHGCHVSRPVPNGRTTHLIESSEADGDAGFSLKQ